MPRGHRTPRQTIAQIMGMTVQGLSPQEISQATGVNPVTIRSTRSRYFKQRPDLKEESMRRALERPGRRIVCSVIGPKKPRVEMGPLTQRIVNLLCRRVEEDVYKGLGLTPRQLQMIKEEVAGYKYDPRLEGQGPVTKWYLKRILDAPEKAH